MPHPKIFFYEAHRRHPDRSLTAPSSLLKYAIPGDNDKPYLPQLYERLPEAVPVTPRKPIIAEQGDLLPPSEALAPARVEEVPEDVRQNWHTALESFLNEYQSYPVNQNFVVNPSLLSALPCYWPPVRILNAKGPINRFRVSLRRMYYSEKLQGASDEDALRTVHDQANELELMALTPLAHYLANLFDTPNELPYVTSAKEWERLSFDHALLSESCRFNRELARMKRSKKVGEMSTIQPSPHFPTARTYLFLCRLP